MAKRRSMKVRNARKSKGTKAVKLLVTKAQAMALGEDFTDISCPFPMTAAQKAAKKGKKRTAGRKK